MLEPIDQSVPKALKKGAARKRHRGKCYEKSGEYIMRHADDEEVWLVHGTTVVPEVRSERYDHAWVEIGGEYVYDGRDGHFYRRDDYYADRKPFEGARYGPHEAARILATTGHYGPWSPEEVGADLA